MLRVELFQVAEAATLGDVDFEVQPTYVEETHSVEFRPAEPESDAVAQTISGDLDVEKPGAYTFDLNSENAVEL